MGEQGCARCSSTADSMDVLCVSVCHSVHSSMDPWLILSLQRVPMAQGPVIWLCQITSTATIPVFL